MRTKVMSWLLALCLMVGLLPATALAAAGSGASGGTVIYVSEIGDDSAVGDESAPLKTIGAAFAKAADGDTICLLSDIVLPSETSCQVISQSRWQAKQMKLNCKRRLPIQRILLPPLLTFI